MPECNILSIASDSTPRASAILHKRGRRVSIVGRSAPAPAPSRKGTRCEDRHRDLVSDTQHTHFLIFTPEAIRHLAAPYPRQLAPLDHIFASSSLSDDDKANILGGTAAKLLGVAAQG